MTAAETWARYQSFYPDLGLERAGLFRLLASRFGGDHVLYPGSFIHVTPSFFFQDVVYVDKNPAAARWFGDRDGVQRLIAAHKTYPEPSRFRFLAQDFHAPLPMPYGACDLLLALFAEGIPQACGAYLKPGGVVASTNHRGEARSLEHRPDFRLEATLQENGNAYCLQAATPEDLLPETGLPRRARRRSRKVYAADTKYYLFRKTSTRAGAG